MECPKLEGPEYVTSGTYAVCDIGKIPRLPQLGITWVSGTANEGDYYADEPNVPANCIAVKLLPECVKTELGVPLNEGEVPVKGLCYDNLKTVDWKKRRGC